MNFTHYLLHTWQLLLITFAFFTAQAKMAQSGSDDLLAVVMIVYDAKEDVCKALDPYVQAGVSSFLVCNVDFNRGTDDTLQTVKEYLDQHHIANYHLMQESLEEPVSAVFNLALDFAEAQFPRATFLLMHDQANRYMQNVAQLLQFCKEEQLSKQPCYRMLSVLPDYNACWQYEVWDNELIRAHTGTRYKGGDSPRIALEIQLQKVPADIFFTNHVPFEEGLKAYRENRKQRDLARMLAAYEKEQGSARTTFYLAYTYAKYGDLEHAYYYYRKRIEQEGYWEETAWAFYYLGNVTAQLSATQADYTWAEAEEYYLKAYALDPRYAEPLVKLAEHYINDDATADDVQLGYTYAKQACELDTYGFKKDLYTQCQQLLQKATAYLEKLEYEGD